MPEIEWSTEVIVVMCLSGLVIAVIGFLLAKLISQPKQTKLQHQNDQLLAELTELRELKSESEQLRQHNHELQIRHAEKQVQIQAERDKVSTLQQDLQQLRLTNQQQNERFSELQAEHTELRTTLSEREKHFQQQLKQLSDSKETLTKEFENLANKIFSEKSKTFAETNSEFISGLLKPFREQIEGFQKRINEVHDASIKGNSDLNAEIKKVLEIGLQMSDEANNLTTALKGDSKQRGIWGEVQLEKTLQLSGLREKDHYQSEASFKSESGQNRRPDYLIKLPDGKHIIIDSKVSLVAYDRAVNADTAEASQIALQQHTDAVKRHIDELAEKDYSNLIGMKSPSFVLMFMPIEPAFIEAMKHNRELFDYGYLKGVIMVSHTTLIPILRTVSNLWMIEQSNEEAREISNKAGEIYNTVCTLAERLQSLGGSLKAASNHYNKTVRSLVGQQGLFSKVDRFTQLSNRITKSLPDVRREEIDIEDERLKLVLEEVQDDSLVIEDKQQSEPH